MKTIKLFGFLAFFEAKMTKIVILDQKLIIPNDYQQFWVNFEWFLSLFQNSDVNVKYAKIVLFSLKTHSKKIS